MRECERKETLCTCVDWETGDLEKRIHHLVCNFEFTGFELEYTTLEPAELPPVQDRAVPHLWEAPVLWRRSARHVQPG